MDTFTHSKPKDLWLRIHVRFAQRLCFTVTDSLLEAQLEWDDFKLCKINNTVLLFSFHVAAIFHIYIPAGQVSAVLLDNMSKLTFSEPQPSTDVHEAAEEGR